MPKPTNIGYTKALSIQKPMSTVATIDVQDNEEAFIVTDKDEVTLHEEKLEIISRTPPLKNKVVLNEFRQICRPCRKNLPVCKNLITLFRFR